MSWLARRPGSTDSLPALFDQQKQLTERAPRPARARTFLVDAATNTSASCSFNPLASCASTRAAAPPPAPEPDPAPVGSPPTGWAVDALTEPEALAVDIMSTASSIDA